MTMVDPIENNVIKLWLEDDVIHLVYKRDCIISLDAAKEIVRMRLEYQKGLSYKGIAFISLIKTVTPEARQYLAKEGSNGVTKVALIVSSSFTTILGNLFVSINKPLVPTKLFSTKEEGMKWLKNE